VRDYNKSKRNLEFSEKEFGERYSSVREYNEIGKRRHRTRSPRERRLGSRPPREHRLRSRSSREHHSSVRDDNKSKRKDYHENKRWRKSHSLRERPSSVRDYNQKRWHGSRSPRERHSSVREHNINKSWHRSRSLRERKFFCEERDKRSLTETGRPARRLPSIYSEESHFSELEVEMNFRRENCAGSIKHGEHSSEADGKLEKRKSVISRSPRQGLDASDSSRRQEKVRKPSFDDLER